MTELLDQALNRVRSLPDEAQDELARVLLRLVGDNDAIYVLSEDEASDLSAAESEIARGELATDTEVEAVFRKFRV